MSDEPQARLRVPIRRTLRRRSRMRTRAQAVVEFAIIIPVFLFLVVLAIDFGRLFFSYVQINNAAREGANYGASVPADLVSITSRVRQETNAQAQRGEASVTVTATCADPSGTTIACTAATGGAGPGNSLTVRVDERFSFLTPLIDGFFGGNLHMNAAATSTVLGYVPGAGATQPPGCSGPSASFVVIVTSGRTVFADPSASTPNSGVCNISGYYWDWGDGQSDPGSATGNPHTYAADGTYTIRLDVTNQAGSAAASHPVTVPAGAPTPTPTGTPGPTATPTAAPTPTPVVCTRPTANFTWTTTGSGSNKIYTYRDASTVADPVNCPITDWDWTFVDLGNTKSNAQNPAPFGYGNNSTHPVRLRVQNAGGWSVEITKNS